MTGLAYLGLGGTARDQNLYVASLTCLAAGTALMVVALLVRRLEVTAGVLGSAGAIAWLLSNAPGEGRVLVLVLPGNGLTVADLLAVPAVLLLAALVWRDLRRPRAD